MRFRSGLPCFPHRRASHKKLADLQSKRPRLHRPRCLKHSGLPFWQQKEFADVVHQPKWCKNLPKKTNLALSRSRLLSKVLRSIRFLWPSIPSEQEPQLIKPNFSLWPMFQASGSCRFSPLSSCKTFFLLTSVSGTRCATRTRGSSGLAAARPNIGHPRKSHAANAGPQPMRAHRRIG